MDKKVQNSSLPSKEALSEFPSVPEANIISNSPGENTSSSEETPSPSYSPSSSVVGTKRTPFFKRFLFFLIFLGVILVLGKIAVNFFSPKLKKQNEIVLNYWGLWEPEEAMRGVIMEWEKNNPNIKINYSFQSPVEYRERLQSALARGEGPDIFRFHLTWLPMFKNELEPVPSTVMSAFQFEKTFYPVINENLRYGTNYLGIPLMIDTLLLYYNEEIFQAAGKSPPTTWDELRRVANELTIKDENGRIQTAGVALGVTSNVDHWSDILGLMMLQNKVDLTNPGECSFQAGEEICLGADALTFFTIFSNVDGVWDETLPSSTQAFASGRLAMYFAPSWRIFEIKQMNPNLNFKVTSVPQLPGSNVSWATFWIEGVAKRSKYKKEAWEFLNFLGSPETLEKLYSSQSNLRLFGEVYPRIEMAEKLKTNPWIEPILKQISNAKTWYLCSRTFDNGINDRIIKYFEDAVNAVNQGKNAKEALQTVNQGVAQILSQYEVTSGGKQ